MNAVGTSGPCGVETLPFHSPEAMTQRVDRDVKNMSPDTFRRLRALACRYWAISPHALDEALAADRIALADVTDLVFLLAHDPQVAPWLGKYLVPEVIERTREEQRGRACLGQMRLWLSHVQRTPANMVKCQQLDEYLRAQGV